MKNNNLTIDLLANAVVQNANSYDDLSLLDTENNEKLKRSVTKSDSITALFNSENSISEKDLRLKIHRNNRGIKIAMKVAVIILTFCSVGLISVYVATGFNTDFLKMFFNSNGGNAVIGNESNIIEESAFYSFSYIPKGFFLQEKIDTEDCAIDVYVTENEETTITISQYIDYNISVDMDNNYETVFINGMACYYIENEGNCMMIFKINDITCLIEVVGEKEFGENVQNVLNKIVENVEK